MFAALKTGLTARKGVSIREESLGNVLKSGSPFENGFREGKDSWKYIPIKADNRVGCNDHCEVCQLLKILDPVFPVVNTIFQVIRRF